ncbi:MAG: helix-turn-helix domain-containing protein [Sphingobium limneticum]
MTILADDLLEGAAAAAAHIGLKPRAVYRMTEGGHLPVIRKGRKLFYRKSDLEAAFRPAS